MILEYRNVVLLDSATGNRVLQAIDGDRVPPPVADAFCGEDPDPLDLSMGLALLSGRLTNPVLSGALADAAQTVGKMVNL